MKDYIEFNGSDPDIAKYEPKRPDDEYRFDDKTDWLPVGTKDYIGGGPFLANVRYRRKVPVKFSYPTKSESLIKPNK